VCEEEAAGSGRERERGQAEVHNQKQEPHTKMWGKKDVFEHREHKTP